jgi:transcriptional regulator with XRE-family HTH domain
MEEIKMTFGEKIRNARKEAGFSQEELAEKMSVSRSAIAKWETDKGMPDVNNLKVMSQLLNVSVDYLLDDEEKISFNEIQEPINLDDYEKSGKCRDKRDAVCLAKHPDASAIYALISNRKLSKSEWIVDFVVQPGIAEVFDRMKGVVGNYLVEKGNRQYFVTVTKDFITTRELPGKIDGKRFVIGNHRYTKGYQIV